MFQFGAMRRQEAHQRARPLGKLEAVAAARRAPAASGRRPCGGGAAWPVRRRSGRAVAKPCSLERVAAICADSLRVADLHADEDVRRVGVGDAVVELGDAARCRPARRSAGSCRAPRESSRRTRASRSSPTSARSATKRRRSKFMFAPQVDGDERLALDAARASAYGLSARDGERTRPARGCCGCPGRRP